MKKIAAIVISIALFLTGVCQVFADTLELPEKLITIKKEAFMDCTSLDVVLLPDRIITIGSKAFAGSSLRAINLPASLRSIADDAFENTENVEFTYETGTYAHQWLVDHGYILGIPQDFRIDAVNSGGDAMSVSFLPVDGAAGYYVYYSTDSTFDADHPAVEAAVGADGRMIGYVNGLEKGTRYYFWAAPYDEAGSVGDHTDSVSMISASLADVSVCNPDNGDVYANKQIVDWNAADPFNLAVSGTGDNGVLEVRAFVMGSEPRFDETDAENAIAFLYGSGSDGVTEFLKQDGAVPFDLTDYGGRYVKIYAALRDDNYDENNVIAGAQFALKLAGTPVTVSGTVTYSSGEPMRWVEVTVTNIADENDWYTIQSDLNGQWSLALTEGIEYSINYWLDDYDFSGSVGIFTAEAESPSFTAAAGEEDMTDERITFTMKQGEPEVSEVTVGTDVDFHVEAPDADYVRLVADGVHYEAYPVVNGIADFSRRFSSSGQRSVCIQGFTSEDGWAGSSAAKPLHVTKIGNLKQAPVIQIPALVRKGTAFELSWSTVPNAQYYTLYIYSSGGVRLYPDWRSMNGEMNSTELTRTFSAEQCKKMFSLPGNYSVQVVASGEGYDSITGYAELYVTNSDEALEIIAKFPSVSGEENNEVGLGDQIDIKVDSKYESFTYEILCNPVEGAVVKGNRVYFTKNGTYTISAAGTVNGEPCTSSNSVSVTVKAPSDPKFTANGKENAAPVYSGSKVIYRIETDFTPAEIKYDAPDVQEENSGFHEYVFSLQAGDAGTKKVVNFSVTDPAGNIYPGKVPVYVMQSDPDEGKALYLKPGTILYSTPEQQFNTSKSNAYEKVTANGGLYGDMKWITYNGEKEFKGKPFFVDKDDCVTKDQIADLPGILSYEQGFTGNVVFTNDNLTWTVTADEGVSKVKVGGFYYLPDDYFSVSESDRQNLDPELCESIEGGEGNQFKCEIKLDECGKYFISFFPAAANDDPFPSCSIPDVLWSVTKVDNNVTKYLEKSDIVDMVYEPISIDTSTSNTIARPYLTPACDTDTYADVRIGLNTPMTYLGYVENKCNYFGWSDDQGHEYKGFFDLTENTQETPSDVRKRAFIAVSNSMAGVDQTKKNSEKALDLMNGLCDSYGYITFTDQYYNVDEFGFQQMLFDAKNTADGNDRTIIYLFSHGNEPPNPEGPLFYSDLEGKEGPYTYPFIVDLLLQIQGDVVVIWDTCYSGQLIEHVKETSPKASGSLTIVTATGKNEEGQSTHAGPRFTKKLNENFYNNRENGVPRYVNVRAKDIKRKIPFVIGWKNIFSYYYYPHYWPEDGDSIVFTDN